MTDKTHSLSLKIDASAANAGKTQFLAAIAAIKKAVAGLDRDTDGAFTKLNKGAVVNIDATAIKAVQSELDESSKELGQFTAAAKRTSVASAAAFRTSANEAQRLNLRLSNIGDTDGITKLNREVDLLTANLAKASTPLDVRVARSNFADVQTSLRRNAIELEGEARAALVASNATAQHGVELDRLRSKYNPLYAASQQYEKALTEIAQAERLGAISSAQASNARKEAANVLAHGSRQLSAYGDNMRVAGHQSQNAAYQIQDVFVTAEMGMNPMRIAIQQGSQLSMVMGDMVRTGGGAKGAMTGLMASVTSMINPVSLLTIGGVAAVAMLTQWAMGAINAGEESKEFTDYLDALSTAVSTYRDYADQAAQSTTEFTGRFGGLSSEAKTATQALAEIARLDAVRAADAAVASLTERFGGLDRTRIVSTRGGLVKEITETFYSLRDGLGLTNDQARVTIQSLEALANAETMAEKVAAANALHESFVRIYGSVEAIPVALLDVTREALNVALNVAEIEGAVTNTNTALAQQYRYYAQTRVESNAVASTAAQMLAGLRQQATMNRLIATYGADSLRVTNARRAAERSVYAETVNTMNAADSVKQELLAAWDAANGSAGAIASAAGQTWGWAGAMSGVRAEINAILSSLSAIGGGVLGNAARQVELTALNAGSSVREAAVARMRSEREQEWSAREAGAGGGVSGWLQGQLIEMERFQFDEEIRLDDAITAARENARPSGSGSRPSGSGSGSSGRTAGLSAEQKVIKQLNDSIKDRLDSLGAERVALDALATGMFETEDAAKLYADAMAAGEGAVDGQTRAMLDQIDAATVLNEKLTRLSEDPVKAWVDSVPTWTEAGKAIEEGAIGSFSDTLSQAMQTGKFDIEAWGDSILATVSDIVADMATRELMVALGVGGQNGQPFGIDLGGTLQAQFGYSAGSMLDPANGGGDLSAAMGGQSEAQMMQTAMVQGGQIAANQMRTALTGAASTSGTAMGAQVSTGAMTGGSMMGTQVTTGGSTAAAQMQAAIVAGGGQAASQMGAASGGSAGAMGGLFSGSSMGAIGVSVAMAGISSWSARRQEKRQEAIDAELEASTAEFTPVDSYAIGTANTSGIPAMLHQNEAVIPLTGNRKVPVELGDGSSGSGGSGGTTVNQTFNITTQDADSFRKSQKQIAADMATSGQKAVSDNR
ncbi:MAG: phage tail length tape measure family protein [Spongiibacteraceae bacterium]